MQRIDGQRGRILVKCAVHFVHPLLENISERVVERRLSLLRRSHSSDLALVERHEVIPALGLCVEPLQCGHGLRIETHVEYLLVDTDRRTSIPKLLVAKAPLLEE